ncbi:hypothetical protein DCAR_0623525 [Daucus carota subsp. sativus]|uniref:Nuclease associated modular domain-containing protein n=1 Tax=Daucus carota subsp. sativus TaxID=79200 RepID=A0AAF1B4W9_DAUCS|nr:hypothetical protein DCAR_0623525 [Daucus carota subsp. sativus]
MPSKLTSSQHFFQLHRISFGSQKLYHSYDRGLSFLWRSFKISTTQRAFSVSHFKMRCDRVLINAVATLEPKIVNEKNAHDGHCTLHIHSDSETLQRAEHQSTSDDELDDREKLRRKRISKANKGKSPWNKGRKHSPETRQRIKEKTRLAMQDPKVRMKLINLGHTQSKETRVKIGVAVRIGWKKRREKLMLQETCHVDWQNLIAEASRRGLTGEEELQWDSYNILDEQLEKEWVESVQQRKRAPRPKGSKRAPKSAEQRKRISEAIAAKWADPAYRDRVYTGLSKYHGTPIGADNPRRRQKRASTSTSILKKKKNNVTDNPAGNERKASTPRSRIKRSNAPIYKDPLASSKLQMIKTIRADRENKKAEAVRRAKLLIAEAENAAKALELAASKSPLAQASLIETRKLIDEAIQSIESIEGSFDENEPDSPLSLSDVEDLKSRGFVTKDQIEVNGASLSNFDDISDSAIGKFNLQQLLNHEDENLPSSSYDVDFMNDMDYLKGLLDNETDLSQLEPLNKPSSLTHQLDLLAPNGTTAKHGNPVPNGAKSELLELKKPPKSINSSKEKPPKSTNTVKKWVRGKLVEVTEGD